MSGSALLRSTPTPHRPSWLRGLSAWLTVSRYCRPGGRFVTGLARSLRLVGGSGGQTGDASLGAFKQTSPKFHRLERSSITPPEFEPTFLIFQRVWGCHRAECICRMSLNKRHQSPTDCRVPFHRDASRNGNKSTLRAALGLSARDQAMQWIIHEAWSHIPWAKAECPASPEKG